MTEFIAPQATAKSVRLVDSGRSDADQWLKNLDFHDDALGQFWHIKSYNPNTQEMRQPSVDWTRDNVRTVVDAARGVWTNGNWVFNAGTIWWPEGLSCPPGHIPARHTVRPIKLDACPGTFGVDPRVQRITSNILDRMISESPRRW